MQDLFTLFKADLHRVRKKTTNDLDKTTNDFTALRATEYFKLTFQLILQNTTYDKVEPPISTGKVYCSVCA